jgi:hypothetical protein
MSDTVVNRFADHAWCADTPDVSEEDRQLVEADAVVLEARGLGALTVPADNAIPRRHAYDSEHTGNRLEALGRIGSNDDDHLGVRVLSSAPIPDTMASIRPPRRRSHP